jgi:acetyl esterase/lipase
MPSLKSHIVALIVRNWHRSAFTSAEGLHRWIRWARQRENHRPPNNLAGRFDIAARTVAGFPVYEVKPRRIEGPLRLLYLHGGAFVFQISSYHWSLIAELAERVGATVTVPIYPIAPEHGLHEMFGMVMEVYREQLAEAAASDIIMVGDSAGGNMAVVLTMMAAQSGLPPPSRHVLISPGLDMSLANPQVFEAAKVDPWLAIPGGLEAVRLYAAGFDRSDWRVSPLYGDLSVLPKTLLLTGTRDILHPDSLVFAERARAAGVEVELFVEPGMLHVWPLIAIPEARRARDRIVAFLQDAQVAAPAQALPADLSAAAE